MILKLFLYLIYFVSPNSTVEFFANGPVDVFQLRTQMHTHRECTEYLAKTRKNSKSQNNENSLPKHLVLESGILVYPTD